MKLLYLLATIEKVAAFLAARGEASEAVLQAFETPPVQYRPKFRYWLPDASVPPQSVIDDIEQIATVGAGGIEFLPFYNYGLGPPVTDWSIYGFGTEAFKEVFTAALNASAVRNLVFDFAFGPNQGAGVPSSVETLGLAKELVYGKLTIQSGETYKGNLPEPVLDFNQVTGFQNPLESWGDSKLVAVVAARLVDEVPLAEYFSMGILDESSLTDLTHLANQTDFSWTSPEGNGTWILFSIYERYTNQRSCVSVSNATTALGNGSWMVDHWSASGAKKTTDFWDQYILSDDGISSLIGEVGEYAWEDSMEMQAALPWTSDLFSRFETLHGYSITKYLPILFHATNAWGGYLPPYNVTYTLGEYVADGGPYVEDYKTALSQGYLDYVEHLAEWAHSKGLKLSDQPAYNMPVDMTQAVAQVPVPELESLGFSGNINQYRQFTGAAHLAGRNLISTEVGAVPGGAYKLRVPELKSLIDGSLAAGVDMMVIHGYAYSGEYVGTTWPGYTPFQYEYTEMWNHRQPAWRHLDDLMLYSARNSIVMQSGVSKIDIAFYYFEIPYRFGVGVYPGSDLNEYGYTFEYLGPENLVSEQATVIDGVLSPDGPAFKCLVIYNQTQISPGASAALVNFARNGLPIYIVGSIPNTTIGARGQQEVSGNIEELLKHDSVRVLGVSEFSASTLVADRVPARASLLGNSNASDLNTFWTSATESQHEYVYLYNGGFDDVYEMTFSVPPNSKPYALNAWTGDQVPLAMYERTSSGIKLAIPLKSNQTTILAFSTSGTSDNIHAVNFSSSVEAVRFTNNRSLEAWVSSSVDAWVTLSNGTQIIIPAGNVSYQTETELGPWNLTVDSFGPSANNDTLEGSQTIIHVGKLEFLTPWTDIPECQHSSGYGTYTTSFELSKDDQTVFIIDFGPVLHTMRAWLNGRRLPPIDPTNPSLEISDFAVQGSNALKIEVTSTLFNAVKANVDRVFSIGSGPYTPSYYTEADWQQFGLIGPVKIRTLRKVRIA